MEASLWSRCARTLEDELPEQQFNTWVRPLQAVEGVGTLRLLAPNPYVVDWVTTHLLARVGEWLRQQVPGDAPILTVEVGSRPLPDQPQEPPAGVPGDLAQPGGPGQRRAAERDVGRGVALNTSGGMLMSQQASPCSSIATARRCMGGRQRITPEMTPYI